MPQAERPLTTLGRSLLLVSMPFYMLGVALPAYGREIGARVVEIGLFFSAFSLMNVLLRPVVGWALDRYGRRPFFITGLLGYAATMGLFALSSQVNGILVARLLQGMSSSLLWLSAYAVTADVADEKTRGGSFGGLAQSSNAGALIGIMLGFTLLNFAGRGEVDLRAHWPLLFGVYGALALLGVGVAWRGLPETRPAARERVQQPIIWSRPWLLLLLVTLVTGAAWAMVAPIIMISLQDQLGAGLEELSWAFFPSALVWALLPGQLGRLADRFGRKPLMIIGLLAAAVGSLIVPNLSSLVAFAALWAVLALCFAAGDPAEQALVADLTGGDQRGRAYGFYALAADLGATIGPFGGAWLYVALGPASPFYANALLLAGCAVVLALFLREPDRVTIAGREP